MFHRENHNKYNPEIRKTPIYCSLGGLEHAEQAAHIFDFQKSKMATSRPEE